MLNQVLSKHFQNLLKEAMPEYLDSWQDEKVLLYLPVLKWKSPASKVFHGWKSLKRCEGKATLQLHGDRKPVDVTKLIAKLILPIKIEPDYDNTPSSALGIELVWKLEGQRDGIGEFSIVTEIEGSLEGTLLEKI